jgi:protein TonB
MICKIVEMTLRPSLHSPSQQDGWLGAALGTRAVAITKAFGISVLVHAAAGVACWQWPAHPVESAAAEPQVVELGLVEMVEQPPEPPAAIATPATEAAKAPESSPAPPEVPLAAPPPPPSPPKMTMQSAISAAPEEQVAVISLPTVTEAPAPQAATAPAAPATTAALSLTAAGGRGRSEAGVSGRSDGSSTIFGRAAYRRNPPPVYPPMALARDWQGTVLLLVHVSPDGAPSEVTVKESSGYAALDDSAVAAVRTWEFAAARVNERAISSVVEVPIRFHLARGKR